MKIIIVLSLMAALMSAGNASAQSLLDLLGKRAESPAADKPAPAPAVKINKDALVGSWKYTGAAVEFTGTDLVAMLGSTMAAPSIRQSLETYYAKAGVVPGSCTVEFAAGDRFTVATAKDRIEGAYAFDHPGQKLRIFYNHKELGGEGSIDARLKFTGDKLQITFEADKIVAVIRELTKDMELDPNIKNLIDMISEYKGLYLGFELGK